MQQPTSTGTQTLPPAASSTGGRSGTKLSTALGTIAVVMAVVALAVNFLVPGPTGAVGPRGPSGGEFTVNTTLLPGQTESGSYAAWGGGSGSLLGSDVNFRVPLTADLPGANTTYIAAGAAYNASCPGPGSALPGQLCVYESEGASRTFGAIANTPAHSTGASKWGFSIYFTATSTSSFSYGSWTVAAS